MKILKYKKEFDYSYALGATLVFELIKHRKDKVIKILLHHDVKEEIVNDLKKIIKEEYLEYNDKAFNILSDKENCFVIGLFNKYADELENTNHLLLVNPSNAGNLGTIIRSSVGFGVNNIAIITPGVDMFDPKVIRSSMGSIFSAHIKYFNNLNEYNYHDRTLYPFMLKAKTYLQTLENKSLKYTLVFGNEATGLPDDYLNIGTPLCIRHEKTIDSLNLQTAVSIALYEFTR